MNGDFLALLPKSPFAAAAGGGARSPGVEATTVFAFHCAAGVIVAGDHRATAGNIIFSDRTEKILELDRHSLLAIAGNPAIALESLPRVWEGFLVNLQVLALSLVTVSIVALIRSTNG